MKEPFTITVLGYGTFIGVHPHSFRPGETAEILGIRLVGPAGSNMSFEPRLCYHIRYRDGAEDYVPISDSGYSLGFVKNQETVVSVPSGEQRECPDTPQKVRVWAEVRLKNKSLVSTTYYFSYTGDTSSILEQIIAKTFNNRYNVPAFGVVSPVVHILGSSKQEILKNFPDLDEVVSIRFLTSEETPCMSADNMVLRPGTTVWFPDIKNNLVRGLKYVPGMTEGPLFSYGPNADTYLAMNSPKLSIEQACKVLDDVAGKVIINGEIKRLFRRGLTKQHISQRFF